MEINKPTNELKPRKERFRRHTKEERKKEKQRYRLKKRMEKKRVEQEHEAIKVTVQAGKYTRGAMILDLAKQQSSKRKRSLKKNEETAPPKKSKKAESVLKSETRNQQRDESTTKTNKPTQNKATDNDKKPKKAATFVKKSPIVPRIRREDLADWPSNEDDKDTDANGGHVGSGSYGHCSKMLYRGNIPVVVKKFKGHVKSGEVLKEAEAMLDLQKSEHHPGLPLLLGINVAVKPYLLALQFCGHGGKSYTLSSAIRVKLLTTIDEWVVGFESLSRTLSFVHSKKWLHNDIKHNNILCHHSKGKWHFVLIDFGKSTPINSTAIIHNRRDPEKFPWLAPEVALAKSSPSTASDVYSLGYTMKYVLKQLSGARNGYTTDSCAIDFKKLTCDCMKELPNERPTTQSVTNTLGQIAKSIAQQTKQK